MNFATPERPGGISVKQNVNLEVDRGRAMTKGVSNRSGESVEFTPLPSPGCESILSSQRTSAWNPGTSKMASDRGRSFTTVETEQQALTTVMQRVGHQQDRTGIPIVE